MSRRWILVLGIAAVVVLAHAVALLMDEPLRGYMERRLNSVLHGYTVRIGALAFHPIGFSLDLKESTLFHEDDLRSPIAHIPRLSASVQWRALLSARLVADFELDRPTLHINLKQARKEIRNKVPLTERGWQEALEAIYPLKVNEFKVRDGDIIYVDEGPFKPLHLRDLNFRAGNIRNVRSEAREYPSDIHLESIVFDSGRLVLDGHADFLAVPHPGILATLDLARVPLDYFEPITRRFSISVRRGILSTTGMIEYAPSMKQLNLEQVTVEGVQVDYVHRPETAAAEKEVATKVARSAQDVTDRPEIRLRLGELKIVKSTFGLVNKAANPPYRVFLADTDMKVANLTNQRTQGSAVASMTGKFMGSGASTVRVTFWPDNKSPDFEAQVRIDSAELPALNDLLRAHAGFDVAAGLVSFYSEVRVNNGTVTGYIKPLLKDVQVYDPQQDRDKPISQRIYKRFLGVLAKVLKNAPRDEVATKAEIKGPVDQPQISTWEVVKRLIQNAFFKAILPGFERDAHTSTSRSPAEPPGPATG